MVIKVVIKSDVSIIAASETLGHNSVHSVPPSTGRGSGFTRVLPIDFGNN